jgi:ribose/xylose/arabinose/galactoside ABC-type transport system permease subunit
MSKINTPRVGAKQNIIIFIINNKALILMLLMFISASLVTPAFLTSRNLLTVMRQISVAAIVSIGYTIIFAAGTFDMSVGEVMSLCGILYALLSKQLPLPLAIGGALIAGIICGFVNGSLIRLFNLPAFVLTLAVALMFKGLTYMITNGTTIFGLSDTVGTIGQGSFLFLPLPFLIMLGVLFCMFFLLNKTIYGRHVIATGGNLEAAKVSGIRVNMIKISVFMVCGVCTAIGSIVLTGRLASATPNMGADFALDAIAAVVIGGTSMHGGKAKVVGTVWGVILVAIIGNMLALLGVSPYLQWIVKGAIIVIAIILDNQTEAILNKQREKALLKTGNK